MNKFLVHRDKTEESSYKVLKRQTMLKCIHKILVWGDFRTTLPGSGSSDRVTGSRSTPALQVSSYRQTTHQRQDKKLTREPCVRRLEATFYQSTTQSDQNSKVLGTKINPKLRDSMKQWNSHLSWHLPHHCKQGSLEPLETQGVSNVLWLLNHVLWFWSESARIVAKP